MRPCLNISAIPLRSSSAGRVAKKRVSTTTPNGLLITPIRFFKAPKSTPVLPPTEASTIASRLVGTFIKSIPRIKVEATKPPKSVTTPPPILMSNDLRSAPSSERAYHTWVQVSMFLLGSPASISMISNGISVAKSGRNTGKQCSLVWLSTKRKSLEGRRSAIKSLIKRVPSSLKYMQ